MADSTDDPAVQKFNFDYNLAVAQRNVRIKAICDWYGVSIFWAGMMEGPEIEWFEKKIEAEKQTFKSEPPSGD